MLTMHPLLALLLIVLSVVPVIAQAPDPVTFTHQIRQFVMRGDDTDKVDMSATFTASGVTFTPKKKGRDLIDVPYASITSLVYDRRSRVRKMFGPQYGKAEDHFLTIQYKRPSGTGDYIEVEMGKDTAPRMLATLEARSGMKVDRASGS